MKVKTRAPFILAAVIIAMLLLSFYSLTVYRERLGDTLRQKVQSDLAKANAQSVLLFNNMIDSYFTQLDTVALFCAGNSGMNQEEVSRLIKSCNEGNRYMRLGVATLEGVLYAGDGIMRDISGMDYFKRAVQGERVISDVYRSGETEEDVIVLAEPVRRDGKIVATVNARYDVKMFTRLMGNSQFEGNGATMVMQKDGRMVSSYEGMEAYPTLYQALEKMDFSGADTLDSLRRRIQNGESGLFTYSRDGRYRYLYFSPTGCHDYTMISLVMAEPLERELGDISEQAYLLVIKNVLFYTVIFLCCWGISVTVRAIIRSNMRDPLTQVYNKAGTRVAVEQILRHQGADKRHACLFMDLDNFKLVNDCYGHEAGDKLLQDVTGILLDNFRKTDVIGRFGGDEFVIWMNGTSLENAEKKAAALCEKLRDVGGVTVSASVGVAGMPDHGHSYAEVLHNADKALYIAKKGGKDMCHVFTPDNGEES